MPEDRPRLQQVQQGDKEGSIGSQFGAVHTKTGQDLVLHICNVSEPVEQHRHACMHACMLKLDIEMKTYR